MFECLWRCHPTLIKPSIILKDTHNRIKTKVVGGENIVDIDIIEPGKWVLTTKLKDIIENIFKNI